MGFGALPEARDLESCGHAQIGGKRRENQGLVNTRGVFRKKKANSGRGGLHQGDSKFNPIKCSFINDT